MEINRKLLGIKARQLLDSFEELDQELHTHRLETTEPIRLTVKALHQEAEQLTTALEDGQVGIPSGNFSKMNATYEHLRKEYRTNWQAWRRAVTNHSRQEKREARKAQTESTEEQRV